MTLNEYTKHHTSFLIQKTKAPKGNAIAVSDFCIVNRKETVVNVLDLLKGFLSPADFIQECVINHKVSMRRIDNAVSYVKLIQEEAFTQCAN